MAQLTTGHYERTDVAGAAMIFPIDPNGDGYSILNPPIHFQKYPDGSSPVIIITEVFSDPNNPTRIYGKGTLEKNGTSTPVRVSNDLFINNKIRKLVQPTGGARRKSRRHRRNRKARKSRRSRH